MLGMDDVLPKPFTRKSLLDMLEKHLVHLKNLPAGIDTASGAPMTAQNSASHSIKEDSTPGQSPAASINNWQSPGQLQGMSPMHLNVHQVPSQYIPQMTPTAPTFAMDQNGVQYPTTQGPMNPAAVQPPHRRPVSEMSSAPDPVNYAKRQRMYPTQAIVGQVPGQQNG